MNIPSTIDNFLWPNRYLLTFLGLWPEKLGVNIAYRLFTYLRMSSTYFVVCTFFIPEVLTIIIFWGDISVLTEIGCVALTQGQLLFKLFYMGIYHQDFCNLYENIKKLWLVNDNKEERESLEKLALLSKRFTIVYFSLCMTNLISFTTASVMALINNARHANGTSYTRDLPFDIWYGVDTQQSPKFEILYCTQVIAMIYGVTGVSGFDSFMMTIILHVCGQFRLLCVQLKNIGNKMDKDNLDSKFEDALVEEIGQCIEYHQEIIRVAKEMDALLSPIIFVQLMTSAMDICLSGYTVMMGLDNDDRGEMMKGTSFLGTVFGQLLIWCGPGQLLIQESTAVGDVICYEVPWYNLKAKNQQNFSFIIFRAQKECTITALGYQIMSLRKLTEVFNAAASYFTLLRSLNEGQTN